jgi:hypothetical protein
MAYLNLFKILLYLLWKKSYSSFPAATLFLSRDTFFGADSRFFVIFNIKVQDGQRALALISAVKESNVTVRLGVICI